MSLTAPEPAARRFAYVFYATSDTYAMAVMVYAHPLFHEIWERWWTARDEVLAGQG